MFWFDKEHPDALYMDIREIEEEALQNGQKFKVSPDVVADFRDMPFEDESFSLVVFDPPHYVLTGNGAWLNKKYGALNKESWREDLRKGFAECFRVLKQNGVLIFKWNEYEISTKEVLALTDQKPLFGHKSGKQMKTHCITFMKL